MKKKIIIFIGLLCIAAIAFLFLRLQKRGQEIAILCTTDLQGYITPHPNIWSEEKPPPLMGGSANLGSYVRKARFIAEKRGGDILLLDAGDCFFGTPEGNFSKGKAVIEIMNMLGYDAMAVGDRDYAFGEENLRRLAKMAKFPFLAANIVSKNNGQLVDYVKPYIIKEYKGIEIGIIGVATQPAKNSISTEHTKALRYLPPIPTVEKYISLLKEKGVEIIIVLSHSGLELDKELAAKIPGIDVIIGGGDSKGWRDAQIEPAYNTIISGTWEKGGNIDRVDLTLSRKGEVINYEISATDLSKPSVKPDAEIQAAVRGYVNQVNEKMKEVIGYAGTDLSISFRSESTLGNWVADVIRAKTGADIALCGGLGAGLKKGDITYRDIYNVSPFGDSLWINDNIAIVNLTGEEIRDILERSVRWAAEESKYGILQVSGLKLTYDPKDTEYRRVKEITINGEQLQADKVYKVAVNGYLASGGDGYHDIKFAEKEIRYGLLVYDLLVDDVRKNSPISGKLEERIAPIK